MKECIHSFSRAQFYVPLVAVGISKLVILLSLKLIISLCILNSADRPDSSEFRVPQMDEHGMIQSTMVKYYFAEAYESYYCHLCTIFPAIC